MEDFTPKQNEAFRNIFGELKKRRPTYRTHAIAMLKMDDENFTKLFTDIDNEVIGEDEDIGYVNDRAKHLGIKN